jgi:ABC-2 type transport system permease protein
MIYPSVIPLVPVISGVYMMPGTITNPVLIFIGDLFPLSHAVEAMMDVALFQAGWNDLLLPIAFMLLIGVVSMGIGINLVERRR